MVAASRAEVAQLRGRSGMDSSSGSKQPSSDVLAGSGVPGRHRGAGQAPGRAGGDADARRCSGRADFVSAGQDLLEVLTALFATGPWLHQTQPLTRAKYVPHDQA